MTNNPYYDCTKFLIDLFQKNPLVNTTIFATLDMRDMDKANIFPLVHIIPSDVEVVDNRIEVSYDVAVVSLRDIPNQFKTDKIFGDNLIDNLGQSVIILSKVITELELTNYSKDIFLESHTSLSPIIFEDKNLLDGYMCSLTLSIQNTCDVC